jgi:hypothetical protein
MVGRRVSKSLALFRALGYGVLLLCTPFPSSERGNGRTCTISCGFRTIPCRIQNLAWSSDARFGPLLACRTVRFQDARRSGQHLAKVGRARRNRLGLVTLSRNGGWGWGWSRWTQSFANTSSPCNFSRPASTCPSLYKAFARPRSGYPLLPKRSSFHRQTFHCRSLVHLIPTEPQFQSPISSQWPLFTVCHLPSTPHLLRSLPPLCWRWHHPLCSKPSHQE